MCDANGRRKDYYRGPSHVTLRGCGCTVHAPAFTLFHFARSVPPLEPLAWLGHFSVRWNFLLGGPPNAGTQQDLLTQYLRSSFPVLVSYVFGSGPHVATCLSSSVRFTL